VVAVLPTAHASACFSGELRAAAVYRTLLVPTTGGHAHCLLSCSRHVHLVGLRQSLVRGLDCAPRTGADLALFAYGRGAR